MLARVLLPVAAAVLMASAAQAATFFTNAGAFAAATTGLTTGDFVGIAPPNGFVSAASYTVAGVTFDSSGTDFVIDPGLFGGTFYPGIPFYSGQFNPVTTISFAGTTAFGMTYGSYNAAGSSVSFTLSDGSVFATSLPGALGTPAFFGFTSAVPITSLVVNNPGSGATPVFDVLSFATGTAGAGAVVPEPQTWALLIVGFGFAGTALRRRRTATA
jgi:hypothetical protein